MKKYLHIIEYSKLNNKIPKKESFENEFTIGNSLYRTSIVSSDKSTKEEIKESLNNDSFYNIYNENKLSEDIINIDDVIIYDDIDIKDKNQKLAYVFECPVCLYKTITTDKDLDFCPQCENVTFPFNLIALINTEQMEDIAIDNKDISKLIIVKDNKIVFEDKPEDKDRWKN